MNRNDRDQATRPQRCLRMMAIHAVHVMVPITGCAAAARQARYSFRVTD